MDPSRDDAQHPVTQILTKVSAFSPRFFTPTRSRMFFQQRFAICGKGKSLKYSNIHACLNNLKRYCRLNILSIRKMPFWCVSQTRLETILVTLNFCPYWYSQRRQTL